MSKTKRHHVRQRTHIRGVSGKTRCGKRDDGNAHLSRASADAASEQTKKPVCRVCALSFCATGVDLPQKPEPASKKGLPRVSTKGRVALRLVGSDWAFVGRKDRPGIRVAVVVMRGVPILIVLDHGRNDYSLSFPHAPQTRVPDFLRIAVPGGTPRLRNCGTVGVLTDAAVAACWMTGGPPVGRASQPDKVLAAIGGSFDIWSRDSARRAYETYVLRQQGLPWAQYPVESEGPVQNLLQTSPESEPTRKYTLEDMLNAVDAGYRARGASLTKDGDPRAFREVLSVLTKVLR